MRILNPVGFGFSYFAYFDDVRPVCCVLSPMPKGFKFDCIDFIPLHFNLIVEIDSFTEKKMKLFNNEKFPVTEELSRFGLYLPSGLKLNKKKIIMVLM